MATAFAMATAVAGASAAVVVDVARVLVTAEGAERRVAAAEGAARGAAGAARDAAGCEAEADVKPTKSCSGTTGVSLHCDTKPLTNTPCNIL